MAASTESPTRRLARTSKGAISTVNIKGMPKAPRLVRGG